ncbi:MAG: hypothetical protein WBG18_04565 [Xanthobacteraceae bacterium]
MTEDGIDYPPPPVIDHARPVIDHARPVIDHGERKKEEFIEH